MASEVTAFKEVSTAERLALSPPVNTIVFDTTLEEWFVWNGSAWLQMPGSGGITALTGDGTATGPGSAAFTLDTVNPDPGTFGSASEIPVVTTNGKGLITGISQVANPGTNAITSITGDGTAAGPGAAAFTLDTVNPDVGTFVAPTTTVNGKGLVTAITWNFNTFNSTDPLVTLSGAIAITN